MTVNDHYKVSIDSSEANFVNFVKINHPDVTEKDFKDINWLAQRIAMNMFYFPDNINTAKSDYISLLALLIKKGVIFEDHKDLVPDLSYPY